MAARLRKMVDGPAALATFRARYDILDEIGLELVEADNFCMEETTKGMSFPIIAIVKGGLRFPLSSFLHRFIVQSKVAPS